ncbi:hypothetical protein PTTG_28372 [Puccinia triticina 1-1 BBBD Race 1]|uniref:Secreted protein n=2 Tax=Puccinia triticina TaxID=208348 RepID=A0A180GCD2_PUCT1|nr:uncharacterized protein PtA15_1A300 [Puccinia triticina]OAV90345.1 hypothetical protein PTTG_28372 [Puccinia triticina 1-1 BBBD Race 1]WAQ80962.1 hypothetical protein PtA15_1A300 [Puccinia triticina]
MKLICCPFFMLLLASVLGCPDGRIGVCFSPNDYRNSALQLVPVQFAGHDNTCEVQTRGDNVRWRTRCCLKTMLDTYKPPYTTENEFRIARKSLESGGKLDAPPDRKKNPNVDCY